MSLFRQLKVGVDADRQTVLTLSSSVPVSNQSSMTLSTMSLEEEPFSSMVFTPTMLEFLGLQPRFSSMRSSEWLDVASFALADDSIIGSFSQTYCFPRAIDLLDSGKIKTTGMV